MFLYTWDKKERKTVMTEKEFNALCDLVDNCESSDNFEHIVADRNTLKILKKFIKRWGEEIWSKNN